MMIIIIPGNVGTRNSPTHAERVVQKVISANPGLKFNLLFILVCSA